MLEYSTMAREQVERWILAECRERGWSWAQACRVATVSENAISELVGGTNMGVTRLTKFAKAFDKPTEYALRLAGLLPTPPSDIPPEIREKADILLSFWLKIRALDPESADRLTGLCVLQSEMVLAAVRSQDLNTQEVEEQLETEPSRLS